MTVYITLTRPFNFFADDYEMTSPLEKAHGVAPTVSASLTGSSFWVERENHERREEDKAGEWEKEDDEEFVQLDASLVMDEHKEVIRARAHALAEQTH